MGAGHAIRDLIPGTMPWSARTQMVVIEEMDDAGATSRTTDHQSRTHHSQHAQVDSRCLSEASRASLAAPLQHPNKGRARPCTRVGPGRAQTIT